MNADRRPTNGKPADTSSSSADKTCEARPADGGDAVAEEEGRPGGPVSEPEGFAPAAESEVGAERVATGTEPAGDAGGEPGPEPGGERGDAAAEEVAGTIESLRAQLDEARDEARRGHDAALRARAEAENARRRASLDVEQAHRFGVEGLVGELLPVRDGLELGIRAAQEEGSTVEALAEGTEMTLRMLTAALEKFGAVEVDPAGEDFDPRFHEAMSMREAEGVESGKVLQVFQKGCLLHGRVVRPAMVIVSR